MYIFAGGGTGGHLYPGLAVTEEPTHFRGQARIIFCCSSRPIDRQILEPLDCPVVPQPVLPLPRSVSQIPKFLLAWWGSKALAGDLIRDLRPAAVLGLGGFAAAPLVKAAAKAHVRTALLNPDALPGKANQHLARLVDVIFTQFESTAARFPANVRTKVRCVGCPVRSELLRGDREEAIQHFELLDDRKTLLIFGGSLAAASINEAIVELADELGEFADRWQVLHVVGARKSFGAADAYQRAGIHARTLEYSHRMDLAYALADLVLSRGGASTIAELTATATPAVILPYPHHRDQQQKYNAASLVRAGAAICIPDTASRTATSLRAELLPLMADPKRLDEMQRRAASLPKRNAASDVAKWLAG